MQQQEPFINQFPEQEILKCPRCDSFNTKFCYYNNYNLSQPRHYCKNCKRYWTKGGTLRNIPVGGASRKIAKRSSSSTLNPKRLATTETTTDVPVTSSSSAADTTNIISNKDQNQYQQTFIGISTSTSPASYLIGIDQKVEETSEKGRFEGLESGDMNCWNDSNNEWTDLAIYTPGAGGSSTFQ